MMESTPNASPAERERPLVLVAEDMQLMVRLMTLHLERAGCDVIAVPDGDQALARSEADLPDLILLDVEMPGQNGFQVLDKLRKNDATRHIPIIMLTAHAKDEPLFAEWAESADLFMTKPFAPSTFVAEVKRILGLGRERSDEPQD
jgi:two-component system phosphate regulon response regulator PhoB